MASVIDSLIVELGLDPSAFTRGQKEAAASFVKTKDESTRMAKEMEERGKQAARFFSRLRTEVIALFAAFKLGGGIKAFVADLISGDAQLGRTAFQLSMSTKELATWQNAVEMVGGTAEGATQSLSGLTSEIEQYRITGTMGQALQVFNRFGISIYDANNHLKNAGTLFNEFNLKVQELLRTDPRAARELLRMLGADQGMQNLLLQNRDAFLAMFDAASKNVPTAAQIAAAQRMQQTWHQIDQALTSLGRAIVNEFGPAALAAIGWMERWISQNRAWIEGKVHEAVTALINVLKSIPWKDVVEGAKDFFKALKEVHDTLNDVLGTKGEIEALLGLWVGAKIAGVIAGVGALASAFGGLAAASAFVAGLVTSLTSAATILAPLLALSHGGEVPPGPERDKLDRGDYSDSPLSKLGNFLAPGGVSVKVGDALNNSGPRSRVDVPLNDNRSTASTVINGPIIIQTQATDAKGIAKDLSDAIKQRGMATQMNRGPN